ncbi:MAG: ribonuclease III [Acidobacteria bacterium]|nr:MAG: ribonuclease III [Acidobacteriota bacterium]
MRSRDITALEETLGYRFRHPELIQQALTHSSQAREIQTTHPDLAARRGDNEQLEFLGDAVLGLVTSQELFQRFPGFREGELSKLRAHLVSERHLIRVAQELELGHYLRLGRGEEKSGGRSKTALLVDALEAILAAIYLDAGLELTRQFILRWIVTPELEHMDLEGSAALPITDFKSALQEALQAKGCPQPSYILVKAEGPEHNKTFTVEVRLRPPGSQSKTEVVGRATGSTKKRAEQDAARQVLEHLSTEAEQPKVASKEKSRAGN